MRAPSTTTKSMKLPSIRQPNGYTCGPTCISMLLKHMAFHPGLPVTEVGRLAHTNPYTGTTDVTMARGLNAVGLSWTRPDERTTGYLRRALDCGNAIVLRTLMNGFKHWVLLEGYTGDTFAMVCPSAGRRMVTDDYVFEIWKARDFDFFEVSTDPNDHPEAKRLAESWTASGVFPVEPHLHSLANFVGNTQRGVWRRLPVIAPVNFTTYHHAAIKASADFAHSAAEALVAQRVSGRACHFVALPYEFQGYRFFAAPNRSGPAAMLVIDEKGQPAAAIHQGLRWVAAPHRSRGLGAEIVLAAYANPKYCFLYPDSYSTAGFASRVAAHRLAVNRAIAAGYRVPDDILADYVRQPDGTLDARSELVEWLKGERENPTPDVEGPQMRLF